MTVCCPEDAVFYPCSDIHNPAIPVARLFIDIFMIKGGQFGGIS